jgi:hypothetical protein
MLYSQKSSIKWLASATENHSLVEAAIKTAIDAMQHEADAFEFQGTLGHVSNECRDAYIDFQPLSKKYDRHVLCVHASNTQAHPDQKDCYWAVMTGLDKDKANLGVWHSDGTVYEQKWTPAPKPATATPAALAPELKDNTIIGAAVRWINTHPSLSNKEKIQVIANAKNGILPS